MAYKIKLMVLGPVATNCYILYNDESKEAVLIDPADRFEIIKKFIDEESLKLKAVLLTHGHFDHIGAAKEICDSYNVELYAHESEKEVLEIQDIICQKQWELSSYPLLLIKSLLTDRL